RLLAVAQELATRTSCASSLFASAGKQVAWAWVGFRTRPDEATIAGLAQGSANGRHLDRGRRAGARRRRLPQRSCRGVARRVARLFKHRAGSVTRWGSVAVLGLLSADVERAREFASGRSTPTTTQWRGCGRRSRST